MKTRRLLALSALVMMLTGCATPREWQTLQGWDARDAREGRFYRSTEEIFSGVKKILSKSGTTVEVEDPANGVLKSDPWASFQSSHTLEVKVERHPLYALVNWKLFTTNAAGKSLAWKTEEQRLSWTEDVNYQLYQELGPAPKP